MTTRAKLALRFAAVVAATVLLLLLAFAWNLRPALPPLPHTFSQPLPGRTLSASLDLAAWAVAV
ncbi:MAG: hypothetical protein ACREF0_02555, partial [Acetobacteraceae bacterium]